jgi:hypothetical protein
MTSSLRDFPLMRNPADGFASGEVQAGTRTIHAFGGRRASRASR